MTIADNSILIAMIRSGLCMFYVTAGLCSVLLLNRNREKHKYILGILLILYGVEMARDSAGQFSLWLTEDYIHNINILCDLVAVPLCALFVFSMLYKNYLTWRSALMNIAPFAVCPLAYGLTECETVFYCGLSLPILYVSWTLPEVFRRVRRYQKSIDDNYSYQDNINLKWLKTVMWMLGLNMLICILLYFCFYSVALLCGYYLYRMFMWMFIMYKVSITEYPQLLAVADPTLCDESPMATTPSDLWHNKLARLFKDEKIFLNSRLTVQNVADKIGVNRTYLSAHLNNDLDTSFYDYVNGFRLEYAESLLRQPDYKITAVAQDSGFNSFNTFLCSFRNKYGCTPSEYRKLARSQDA